MHRATADDLEDPVAELLDTQRFLHNLGMGLGHLQGVIETEEVWGMQHRGVQHMALDPLPAVDQTSKVPQRPEHLHPEGVLHGLAGAELIGDGADPTDPGGDVRRVPQLASDQQGFEEPRRLVYAELDLLDRVTLEPDV